MPRHLAPLLILILLGCSGPDERSGDVTRPPSISPTQDPPSSTPRPEALDVQSDDPQPPKVAPAAQDEATAKIASFGALMVPPGALDALKARLDARTARPFVAVHYGDSHSKIGVLPAALRDALSGGQLASPGYVSVGHPLRWGASLKVTGRWKRHNWLYGKDEGSFGPMGVAWSTADPGARATLALEDGPARAGTRAAFFHQRSNGHLPFEIRARDKVLAAVAAPTAHIEGFELGRVEVEVPEGVQHLELRPSCRPCPRGASLNLYGASVHHPAAAIEYDNFGVGGTTIIGPHKRSDHTLDDYLAWRRPDLLVLWYGANSAPEPSLDIDNYKARYRELVQRLRAAAPDAACLLIAPPDLARYSDPSCFMTQSERELLLKKNKTGADQKKLKNNKLLRACNPGALIRRKAGGGLDFPAPGVHNQPQWASYVEACRPRTPEALPHIVRVQKEVAAELGCAYFDTFADMGGVDSVTAWTCGDPPLASPDLIHLTRAGYERVAQRLFDALTLAMP